MVVANPSRENMESNSISMDTISENCLVVCKDVYLRRDAVNVIENIHIEINESEIVTIVGPNGSGKTTTLKILLGLQKPDQGKVYKRKNLIIGYMPQKISIEKIMPITVRRFLRL